MSKLTSEQICSSPMPRDIDISQSLEGSLSHIAELAEECGILESELEPYGRFKAKVTKTTRLLSFSCSSRRVQTCFPCFALVGTKTLLLLSSGGRLTKHARMTAWCLAPWEGKGFVELPTAAVPAGGVEIGSVCCS